MSEVHEAESGYSRKTCSIDGTKCAMVMLFFADELGEICRIFVPFRPRDHQSGARHQGRENSSSETSKVNGVFCSIASEGRIG